MGLRTGRPAADREPGGEDFFVGDWLVQPGLGLASAAGVSHHLEPKVVQLLRGLAERPGEVVSKHELLRLVWPDVFVTEHVLTQAIFQLRQVLGGDAIETIPRRGYRIAVPVRAAAPAAPSIAVLPLANMSGDASQEFFADGMTEALISALAQIHGLRVISRTSVMQYKETTKRLRQIAEELTADRVVEGSVCRSGERVRISVQLIDGVSDQHIWARTYDRGLRDVLDVQDEIARTIAAEIRVTLTPDEQARLARARPVNAEAHDLYLKGRYWHFLTTEDALRTSVDYMRRAIALDPEYAMAHAGLASSMMMLASPAVSGISPADAIEIARPAGLRALELDPHLAAAHHMVALIHIVGDWEWAAGERALRQAIALNPSAPDPYAVLARLHTALMRPADAVAAWQHACRLDPLSLFCKAMLGYMLVLAGRLEEGVERWRKIVQFAKDYYYPYELISGALSLQNRHEEAIAAAEAAVRIWDRAVPRGYLGYVLGRAGRVDAARRILDDLQHRATTEYVTPLVPAAIRVALGEFDGALDDLERAQEARDMDIVFIRSFPAWRPLHGHPRFGELVRRMNFPA